MVADSILHIQGGMYPYWLMELKGLIAVLSYRRSLLIKVILSLITGFLSHTSMFNIFIKGYAPAIISFMKDFFVQALVSLVIALILYKSLERALKVIMRG